MMRTLIALGACVLGGVVLFIGVALWYRHAWLQEMHAQCASATPFVDRHAEREQVIGTLGEPSSEHSASDLAWLTRAFGEGSPKTAALQANLRGATALLLYSRSNSVMFVYLDGEKRAIKAECFLQ